MAAKEKSSSRLSAWLAPLLLLLAAVAVAVPASASMAGALETRAWEKTSSPLESRLDESLQLLNLHQQNGGAGYDDALGSPLAAENTAMRSNVLANIAASKAARATSNIDVLFAKEAQLNAGYGVDSWSMTTLSKGAIVYGGTPGQSAFYTDAATVVKSGGSRATLFQSLQSSPSKIYGYRPAMSMYRVLEDIRVPTGTALGNPSLGVGGGNQFMIRNYSQYLRESGFIPLGK